jgi:capsular exopolysaccharide synthesis family protein
MPAPPDLSQRGLSALEDDGLPWESALRMASMLRRRWWLVAVLGLGAMLIAGAESSRVPIVYRATATILLEGRPHVVDKVTSVSADAMADSDRFANSQVRILTSERMARQVEKRLGIQPGTLDASIDVQTDRNSQLLTLAVDHKDPERARTIVNAFTDAYIDSTVNDDTGANHDAANFLTGEAKGQRKALEDDERVLYEFQRLHGLPASNFEESHRIYSSNLQSLHGQEAAAFGAGVKIRAELEQLRAAKNDPQLRRSLTPTGTNSTLTTLHARYATLVEQAAQYEAHYGPQHPKLLETQEAIKSVRTAIDEEVRANEAALEARSRSNASEQSQLKAAIAAETQRALDLRQNELEYNRLKRKLDEDKESYDIVAKREKELEIQAGVKQSYVRRLDAAVSAVALPRPIVRATALGLVVGLVLGIGLAFLFELIDDTIRSPHEVSGRLHAPLLGFITQISPPGGRSATQPERAEYVVRYPRSAVSEQCHSLATTMYSLFLDKVPRVIALASPASGDGKTLTSVNLASALSARGKRVLIIDCDLRRGSLHKLFGLARGSGVFELATGQLTTADAPRRTFVPNVDVITCGEVPDKVAPTKVLELPQLRTCIATLRERYDLIIIDTPPVPMVSDVLVMRDMLDGLLGVFRAGQTSARVGSAMERHLGDHKLNFLGWVLNGVDKDALLYRYYRRYGYGARDTYADPVDLRDPTQSS